ncbi:MAG: riboflavin kinase [Planctomycetota bacterium]|nr:riboflavin kinase [Planctomycetota bacterium]
MSRSAVTIGNFDGVHAGHAALLAKCREAVRAGRADRVVAMTFDPHPASLLRPGTEPARLTTLERRRELLRAAGADEVVALTPTPELLDLSPEDFVRRVVREHGATVFAEGPDFRFGRGRGGGLETLRALGPTMGFALLEVAPVEVSLSDHTLVPASSSVTRWLVSHGRVGDARRVLSRADGTGYELEGTVTRGDRRGRTIGFPTANLACETMLPDDGVYAARATVPGRAGTIPAALNVGTRPTFQGVERRVEAHIIGLAPASAQAPEIPGLPEYGWRLRLELVAYLRDQVKFASLPALVEQLGRDVARAREIASQRAEPTIRPVGAGAR